MKMVTTSEMQELEKRTVEEFGISPIVLMENAAIQVLKEIEKRHGKRFVVVCGKGNNGGDGFVIARHLFNQGKDVHVFVVGKAKKLTESAEINYNILKKLKVEITEIENEGFLKHLKTALVTADVTVDAILGTGLKNIPRELTSKSIDAMNSISKYIISVDLPSGVCSDNGAVLGAVIDADETVVMSLAKCGNVLFPGSEYNGELKIRPIGIPKVLIDNSGLMLHLIEPSSKEIKVPVRRKNSHKGTYGKAGIVSGSTGMSGAAILLCKGALRTGVGLIKLYVPESLNTVIKSTVPEVITIPLQEVRKGVIGINHIPTIIEQVEKVDVLAMGPGCGNTSELSEIIRRTIESAKIPLVIDADGLNALSRNLDWLDKRKGDIILTPHIGEMAKLTGKDIEDILNNPIDTARELAVDKKVYVVLKSSRTVIAMPSGEVYININGNPGMATAGSGDVLTGIISGLIAQGVDIVSATVTGVYIHGMAGDIMVKEKGEYGLIAGDIIEGLAYALNTVRKTDSNHSKRRRDNS